MFSKNKKNLEVREPSRKRSGSLTETVDEWVEEMNRKLRGLSRIFPSVDKETLKQSVSAKRHGIDVNAVKQFSAMERKERREKQKERLRRARERRKDLRAKRVAREKKKIEQERNRLIDRFKVLPVEEIQNIYEECGGDYEKTTQELLLLVALVEQETQTAKSVIVVDKDKVSINSPSQEEEEKFVDDFLLASMSPSVLCAVSQKKKEEEDREALFHIAAEQFMDMEEEEIRKILEENDWKTDTSIKQLLIITEDKKVAALQDIFHDITEEEIREILTDNDWDVVKATETLNSKQKPESKPSEEELTKTQEKCTLGRRVKQHNIGMMFEQKMKQQQQQQELDLKKQREKELNSVVNAKKSLAQDLERLLTPTMIMGRVPLRKPTPPSTPPTPTQTTQPEQKTESATDVPDVGAAPFVGVGFVVPSSPEDKRFVDTFIEIRRNRAMGAAGRRAPARKRRARASTGQT